MGARLPALRDTAEDLRDASIRLVAAIIAGRVEDAAYAYRSLIVELVKDLDLELERVLITRTSSLWSKRK